MDGDVVNGVAGGGPGQPARRINDAPLRAALENRRGRVFDEAL